MVLAKHRKLLPGTVRFVFQPAEEHSCGGKKMVEAGALRDPPADAAFAMHGWPESPLGSVLIGTGPILSAASAWKLELKGTGTHAAYPHFGKDVILTAAEIVTRLQRVVARLTDPVDLAVVSVTSIHAGDAYNVLPERLTMLGTIRGLRQETHDAVADHVRRLIDTTASGAEVDVSFEFVDAYPALVNHPLAAHLAQRIGFDMFGDENVVTNPPPSLGAEDFAYYAREVPSAMWRLGLRPPDRDRYPMLHQPDFDFGDQAVPLGVEMHCRIAHRFLTEGFGEE